MINMSYDSYIFFMFYFNISYILDSLFSAYTIIATANNSANHKG